jgi:ribonuclease VapC
VIFVDTSAIVAIVAAESDAATFAARIEAEGERICAGHVILEAAMRLSSMLGLEPTVADGLVTRALRESGVIVVPITEDVAHIAVRAFERYGKGRGKRAKLNFGDCLSYACAKAHGAALLYKGGDFSRTDIARA